MELDLILLSRLASSMNCLERFCLGMTESSDESSTEGEALIKVEGTEDKVEA